jgi:hypothetical protein
MPSACRRSAARDEVAISTTSGLSGHDGFDVRVQPAAHLRQLLHAVGEVGIAVDPDQAMALAQLAHGLGQRRQQADDALRAVRQRHHTYPGRR